VVGHPDAPGLVGHRLMTARREIDNGKTGMRHAAGAARPPHLIVGTAMPYRRDHLAQSWFRIETGTGGPQQQKPGNSAHQFSSVVWMPAIRTPAVALPSSSR